MSSPPFLTRSAFSAPAIFDVVVALIVSVEYPIVPSAFSESTGFAVAQYTPFGRL